jgi:hypothetical protein
MRHTMGRRSARRPGRSIDATLYHLQQVGERDDAGRRRSTMGARPIVRPRIRFAMERIVSAGAAVTTCGVM